MRAVRFHEYGEPDVLQVDEVPSPEPGPNEILVDVAAASVNPIDALLRNGVRSVPVPMVAGSDFAGTVTEVGSDVDEFEVGDRVFGTGMHPGFTEHGTYAESTVVRTDLVAKLPSGVSFDTAAASALVGVTAWRGLIDRANLQLAESCLIHGGSGGVGHVAVQLAATSAAHVVSTGATERLDRIREFGADEVLCYDSDTLRADVLEATDGGADVIFDHRLDDYHQFDIDVAAMDGRVVVFGGASGTLTEAGTARGSEVTVHHMSMTNLATEVDLPNIGPILSRLATLLETGEVQASIDRRYDLEEAAEAQRAVMEDQFVGKLVIEP
jgi:NADPH:quinone reductase-like Zn-dependent oxidoreductase